MTVSAASSPWSSARTAATTSWWRATRHRAGAASRSRREHIVARTSTDGGRTWPWRLVVEPAYGGYSTLVKIDRVGIMYGRYPRLSFRTFYLGDCT